MRKSILTAATCVAVAMAGAAAAKPKKPEDPNKVICRISMNSGSHIGQRRICMTRADWKMEDDARANEADGSVRRTWDRAEQEAPREGPPF